jgi:DNA-binding XRE family transcriptional regulator
MNLGQQIRDIRNKRGIKQKWLAKEIGISTNALCSIEKNKAWPSCDTMTKICQLFEVELKLIEE